MSAPGWHGDLWLGGDFALLHGQAGPTAAHAHYAHQVLLSPGAPVNVTLRDERIQASCVLVPSMYRHAVLSAPDAMFTVFAEPTSCAAGDLWTALFDAAPAIDTLLGALAAMPRRMPPDSRVARALAAIDAQLEDKLPAAGLADAVQVSLSQLERLFSRHVGLPVRQLVRWRRLRLALRLALEGTTLTGAAHRAGFADSAHLSRTMRRMFGVRADRTVAALRLHAIGQSAASASGNGGATPAR